MNPCDVGKLSGNESECHKKTYSSAQQLHKLLDEDRELLRYRVKIHDISTLKIICEYHKNKFLDYYSSEIRKCCDPYEKHQKNIKDNLRIISLSLFQNLPGDLKKKCIPGDKICVNCEKSMKLQCPPKIEPEKSQSQQSHSSSFSLESTPSGGSIYVELSQEKRSMNDILSNLEIPPCKRQRLSYNQTEKMAMKLIHNMQEKIIQKVSTAMDIDIPILQPTVTGSLLSDSVALRQIIASLQDLVKGAKTVKERINYLALLPGEWKYSMISKYIPVSRYVLREAREQKLRGYPRPHKRYNKVSEEMKTLIQNYYVDEQNCYICPGKRDYKIVKKDGTKEFVQKKMLLYTLHDLYQNFLKDYSDKPDLPKFTYFYTLKPKECIYAGDPGTHNICVCAQHQNVKLQLSALTEQITYRDLLAGAVCDLDNPNCMLHRCDKCPGIVGVHKILTDNNISWEKNEISYKHWAEEGSRAYLKTVSESFQKFKKDLCQQVWALTEHHYIGESQKNFLFHCKKNLQLDTCIILMDFSENYSFIIQNSTQGFYYNNDQATIHPFVIYCKIEGVDELQNESFCIVSDTKEHYAATIHAFQEELMNVLKERFPWIKNVIYFSDGAPSQYKNKNHLANVLYHKKDFGIAVLSYNFFATSHGKSACDGIGGAIKRTVMRHCLRSKADEQITTAREFYEYASKKISGICALWVPDVTVNKHKRKLNKRFMVSSTIKDTRKHHQFVPMGDNEFDISITSFDESKIRVEMKLP